MAVLLAGLPTSGHRRDRQPAVRLEPRGGDPGERARSAAGDASLVVAGGVESMSRAPWVLLQARRAPTPPATRRCIPRRSAGGWSTRRCRSSGRSRSARAPRSWPRSTAISREAQDEFALRSHRLAARACDDGVMGEVVPVPGVELERDEGIRADTLAREARRSSTPAFVEGGTVTAGNSSPLNDGASMLLIGDEARRRAARPRAARARRRERGARRRPRRLRDRAGRGGQQGARASRASAGADVAVVELNEAFASQSLACLRGLAGAGPRARQHARRRDRDRPSARRVGGADPRTPRPRAARPRRRLRPRQPSASALARASP